MNQFLLFLRKIYFIIMFLLLELLAFSYYSGSSVYANAKVIAASNSVIGFLYKTMAQIESYFYLKTDNEALLARVVELERELEGYRTAEAMRQRDSIYGSVMLEDEKYYYMKGHVVGNTINRKRNYLTIDKGSRDGVVRDMAILSNGCLVGYVVACSPHYSVGMSFLNTKFVTSGQSSRKSYYGSIRWPGVDYTKGRLTEVPKYADIAVGDTIVTTQFSSRFPAGIPIGVISSAELINGINYEADVDLLVGFGRLYNVELVASRDVIEKLALERSVNGFGENMTEGEIVDSPAWRSDE